jgi:hypothetical protein
VRRPISDLDYEIKRRARLIRRRTERKPDAQFGVPIEVNLLKEARRRAAELRISMPALFSSMLRALVENHPAVLAMVDQYRVADGPGPEPSTGPLQRGSKGRVFDDDELGSIYDELESMTEEDDE